MFCTALCNNMLFYAVPPVVEVTASRMKVNIRSSTILFCNVTRTNPHVTDYTWMDEDTNTEIDNDNMAVLMLALLTEQDFGTISCTATNAAGISGKANVTIEQGCKLILLPYSENPLVRCLVWQFDEFKIINIVYV